MANTESTPRGPDPGPEPCPEGIFGLDTAPGEAALFVIGVPFDATTSYRKGAADGPAAILRASRQVDLEDPLVGNPAEAAGKGIWMAPIEARVVEWNLEARGADVARVNALGDEVNRWVHTQADAAKREGKIVAVLGGDHSVAFGAIQSSAEHHGPIGLLQFDAHADLRRAYEGYTWSHASIMGNVLDRLSAVERIVQVGVRDLCAEERARIDGSRGRLSTVYGHDWGLARSRGEDLSAIVRAAIEPLPEMVHVTFDVDGLDPTLCPNTGTPVPGGLLWDEAMLWLVELVASGRRIVGFDLTEISPGPGFPDAGDSYDAMVGARLLYRLAGFALGG